MQINTNTHPPAGGRPLDAKAPLGIRIGGIVFRTIFLLVFIVATAHVAAPQIETYWSAYETPGDLIRMALGLAICLWCAVHLFLLPKDAGAYRTWLYLGVTVVPLAVICTIVIW